MCFVLKTKQTNGKLPYLSLRAEPFDTASTAVCMHPFLRSLASVCWLPVL
ncbi:hypothetical protein ACRRTK_000924 [Alexandromys fortis]